MITGVLGPVPAWLPTAVARLNAALALPDNWDGEGATRIDPVTAVPLITLLIAAAPPETPAPRVVPTIVGSVQLEWHTNGIDLEIEATNANELIAAFEDHVSGEEFDGEVSPAAPQLKEAIRRVSQRCPALSGATTDAG